MPNYVQWRETGAAYFFTVVTFDRRPFLTPDTARACLREAWLGMRDDFLAPTVLWECRVGRAKDEVLGN